MFIIVDKESNCFVCKINNNLSWTGEKKWAEEFESLEKALDVVIVLQENSNIQIEIGEM